MVHTAPTRLHRCTQSSPHHTPAPSAPLSPWRACALLPTPALRPPSPAPHTPGCRATCMVAPHTSGCRAACTVALHTPGCRAACTIAPHTPGCRAACTVAPHTPGCRVACTVAPHIPGCRAACTVAPHTPGCRAAFTRPSYPSPPCRLYGHHLDKGVGHGLVLGSQLVLGVLHSLDVLGVGGEGEGGEMRLRKVPWLWVRRRADSVAT